MLHVFHHFLFQFHILSLFWNYFSFSINLRHKLSNFWGSVTTEATFEHSYTIFCVQFHKKRVFSFIEVCLLVCFVFVVIVIGRYFLLLFLLCWTMANYRLTWVYKSVVILTVKFFLVCFLFSHFAMDLFIIIWFHFI